MDNIDKILQRIKKLLKHSESAKNLNSIEEAESFAKKAQELMLEYNLTMAQVAATAEKDNDEFAKWVYGEEVSYHDNQSGSRWRYMLVQVLCEYNFCNFTYKQRAHTFRVYGNMENVDVIIWLYHFLSIGLLRIAQEHHVALPPETKRMYNRYAFLKDFLLGAVTGIHHKLEEQRQKQMAANNKVNALMVVNKDALNRYRDEKIQGVKPARKSKRVYVGSAYKKGYEIGKNYNITKPLDVEKKQDIKKLK